MSAHTPGPWQWYWRVGEHLKADCGVFHEVREGQAVAVCRAPQYAGQRQWEADARLIAAAPEMYEALLAILPFIPISSASEGGAAKFSANVRAADQVRAAIDKAEGRCS